MDDTLGLIAGIGLAVVVAVVLMKYSARKKASSWAGTVSNIKRYSIQTNEQELPREEVAVHYKTDDGKKGKLTLTPDAFEQSFPGLQVGDRLIKSPGEYMPRKE